jgi:hypothetical protein
VIAGAATDAFGRRSPPLVAAVTPPPALSPLPDVTFQARYHRARKFCPLTEEIYPQET